MIILDTHIWIWWSGNSPELAQRDADFIRASSSDGIGVSIISCWEVALLRSKKRLDLDRPVLDWINVSLSLPDIILLPISPEIAVESNELPNFPHRDPADRIIVATARVLRCPLVTNDSEIRRYPYVDILNR